MTPEDRNTLSAAREIRHRPRLIPVPVSLKEANDFVESFHRHSKAKIDFTDTVSSEEAAAMLAEIDRLKARCEALEEGVRRFTALSYVNERLRKAYSGKDRPTVINEVWSIIHNLAADAAALSPPDQEPAGRLEQPDAKPGSDGNAGAPRTPTSQTEEDGQRQEPPDQVQSVREQYDEEPATSDRGKVPLLQSGAAVAPTLPADVAALVERLNDRAARLHAGSYLRSLLEEAAAALASARRVGPGVEDVARVIDDAYGEDEGWMAARNAARNIAALSGYAPTVGDGERDALAEQVDSVLRWACDQAQDLPDIHAHCIAAHDALERLTGTPLNSRARLIRAMQENLSCEYDSDQKGDASWTVSLESIERAADAILKGETT